MKVRANATANTIRGIHRVAALDRIADTRAQMMTQNIVIKKKTGSLFSPTIVCFSASYLSIGITASVYTFI